MKKQYITIELEEYKRLRDKCETLEQFIGAYNLLKAYYDNLVAQVTPQVTTQKVKEKRKIGFRSQEE